MTMVNATSAPIKKQIGTQPRADLLPPEIKADAKAKAQRKWLVALVIFAIVLVAGGYLASTGYTAANQAELEAESLRTADLLGQQAQFSEARQLDARISLVKDARAAATQNEIDWKAYLTLVEQSLPSGTSISTISATTTAPGSTAVGASNPLKSESIALISFTATTPSVSDVSKIVDNLAKLPGYGGAVPGSIALNDDGQYSVSIVMNVGEAARLNRFLETGESK